VIVNFLKPILQSKEFVCFYSKFVHKAFMHYGVRVNIVHDTFVLAHHYHNYYQQPAEFIGHLAGLADAFLDFTLPAEPPVDGTEKDYSDYCCQSAWINQRLLREVFRSSVFFSNTAYLTDVTFALACAYSEYFGMHFASLDTTETSEQHQLVYREELRFPRIRYAAHDGELKVSKPDYLKDSFRIASHEDKPLAVNDHDELKDIVRMMLNVTPRNGYYMAYSGYDDLLVRVVAAMIGGTFGSYIRSCDHETGLYDQLVWRCSRSTVDEPAWQEALRALLLSVSIFDNKDDPEVQDAFNKLMAPTQCSYEDLHQWFMKQFNDPYDYFSAYVTNARRKGYVQSHFGRYFSCQNVEELFSGCDDSEAVIRDLARHVVRLTMIDVYKKGVNRLIDAIYQRGWFGKVLLPAFLGSPMVNAVLMEVDNTINPREFTAVFKTAFNFEIDGEDYLDYRIGFGNSWSEARCHLLDGYEEAAVFNFFLPWRNNINLIVEDLEDLRKPRESNLDPDTPNKKARRNTKPDRQNRKSNWFR
jgi:hypothetical protein